MLRQGVASLYRPGNQTRAVVLALGFGVFLMSTVYQVQRNLLRTVSVKLDASRANVVFFDVQDDQGAPLDALIRSQGYSVVQRTPIVPMKIASINGVSSANIVGDTTGGRRRRAGWAMRREFRSTFRDEIVPSERVTAGKFHTGGTPATTLPAVSVDKGVAEDLKLAIGDTIVWDVQGVRVPTRVTSFREVNWTRFEPQLLRRVRAPSPRGRAEAVRAPRRCPRTERRSASAARRRGALPERLEPRPHADPADRRPSARSSVTAAIRFLAGLSLALGVPVLFSAVSATRRERLREGVLLKVLGATRRQVGRIMLSEYLLLGALGSTRRHRAEHRRRVGAHALRLQAALRSRRAARARRRARDDRRVRVHRNAHRSRRVPRNTDGGATRSVTPPSSVGAATIPTASMELSGIVSP